MKPFAYRTTDRPVENAAAHVDVVLDERVHHLRRLRLSRRSALDRRERLVWDQPGTIGEPVDGVGASSRAGDHHEIDSVAAVIAGPASPTLVASMVAVQRDRSSMIVVVGRGAMPTSARSMSLSGLGELVEQGGQISAVEHVADVPAWAAVMRDVHPDPPSLDRYRTRFSHWQ